jgi:hypothetical protein
LRYLLDHLGHCRINTRRKPFPVLVLLAPGHLKNLAELLRSSAQETTAAWSAQRTERGYCRRADAPRAGSVSSLIRNASMRDNSASISARTLA